MDTKEVVTNKGYKAIITTRITSKIYREIQAALYEGMEVKPNSGKFSMTLAGVSKQQEKAMELLLISITDPENKTVSGPDAYKFLQNMEDFMDAEQIYSAVESISSAVPLGKK